MASTSKFATSGSATAGSATKPRKTSPSATVRRLLYCCAFYLVGCSQQPAIDTVDYVDLERFMGDWYVIGFIPLPPERDAHNGIESYSLEDDGRISTTYRFREGGFDGELKRYQPNAKVREGTGNAEWGMQFIWPFRAEFLIAYLDSGYQTTIIARNARDFVWLMARQPDMSDEAFAKFKALIGDMGYDTSEFVRQPQRWPEL